MGSPALPSRARGWPALVREWLPTGGMLSDDAWRVRHRGILRVLWVHAVVLGVVSLLKGHDLAHSVLEMLIPAAFGLGGLATRHRRRLSTMIVSVGLLTCSAVLVHLFHGRIEMHFSYFVMVGIVTLYQDWLPLLVSIGYVVLQHGV